MSNKLMTFEKVLSVRTHPNADKLDIVTVAGYEAIVGRGTYTVGQGCFLVHPDASLPKDREWAKEYLGFVSSSTRRVKAKNIRGEWSFGLVIPFHQLATDPAYPEVGTDLSEVFGVTKYEPPLPVDLSVKGPLPFNIFPTDENRYQNLDQSLVIGRKGTITEKIDGSSLTVYCVLPGHCGNETNEPILGYCARNNELKIPEDGNPTTNLYWEAVRQSGIFRKLKDYCQETDKSLAIRGEVCGVGVQAGVHNLWSTVEKHVRWFSLLDIQTLEYLPFKHITEMVSWYGIRPVPVLWDNIVLTQELINRIETSETLKDMFQPSDEGRSMWDTWNELIRHNSGWTSRKDMFEGAVFQYINDQGKVRSFKIMNKPYDQAK